MLKEKVYDVIVVGAGFAGAIVANTKVEQVVLEKRGAQWTATGVWYREQGASVQKADAKKVILAGALGNILLLYASGYGSRDLLGDKLMVENPNVGSHISGHPRGVEVPAARFEDLVVHEPGDGNFGFWLLDDKDNQGSKRLFICSGAETHGSDFGGAHSYALSQWAPEFGHAHKGWMRGDPGFIHEVGGCRAGTDGKNSVVNSNFECHDIANLFVVDSSSIPRETSLWSGGTVAAVVGTFAARRIIAQHFRRSSAMASRTE